MNVFDGYNDHYNETVRLTILKGLAKETDYRLNDAMIQSLLVAYAINRGRDYLRNQLRWLETEAQAVKLTEHGSAMIAEITENGLDHVERRAVLQGVRKPSPQRG